LYTGQVAIALAARGVRRDVPLWILVLASQGCDWVEMVVHRMTPRSMPDVYSHAVPFVLIPAIVFAAVVWAWKRSLGAAIAMLAVYLSHPIADLVTGIKPLWLGGPNIGLGLIHNPLADLAAQAVLCAACAMVYSRSLSQSRHRLVAAGAPLAFLLSLQSAGDGARLGFRLRRQHRTAGDVQRVGSPMAATRAR
jgi:hypothetical protein